MITVLTPSYNREHTLRNAYDSLRKQSNKDFEWLIIDDGSNDNTDKLVKLFINEKKLNIRYLYKKNGGKHTALNEGIKIAKGEYIVILDSDDVLTSDAIETIYTYFDKYKTNPKICALSFLKTFPNGKKVGTEFEGQEIISNNISFRYNQNVQGDMAEVYKTDILKKYPFPVYNNERFLSEAIVWNKIALDYDTVYINKGIYICDYLVDGLSNNFFKLVYNSPIGALENANMFLIKEFNLRNKLRNAILYDGYSMVAKRKVSEIIKKSNNKLLSILFLPLGFIWKIYLTITIKK